MSESKKILVAEDDAALAKVMELKLSKSGLEPIIVNNGREAIDKLKQEKFDLLLLDLIMPQMDGFQVLEELKKNNNTIPVIVSTNLEQDEDRDRVKALGAKDYIVKSNIPINQIIETIKQNI